MGVRGEITAFNVVESLTGWWELAGLDAAVSETSVNWLAEELPSNNPIPPMKTSATPEIRSASTAPSVAWPEDISSLRELVAHGAPLPGNGYGPLRYAPIGPDSCDIMIVSDLPDIIGSSDTSSEANAALLRRMMGAIGIESSDCYCTWMATSMPSTAEVPEYDFPELAAFVMHQIKLIRPKSVVILGASACKALLSENLMNARAELRNINHDGLNIAVLATFHPRTLVARPAMKAEAWRDLQMFGKRQVQ